jgi:glycosyltransferase involved in cell wall biosynthesis
MACYNPREKILPIAAKLPLLGRKRRLSKWMNKLDGIVALSTNSRQLLLDRGVGSPSADVGPEIHIIPLPITLPQSIVAEKDPNLVAFVGGSPGNKGKKLFFEAERLVKEKRPDVHFEEIKANSREGALEAIASAQVLMVPELWPNPGPVVVVEAALLGTNVVTSDVGGIKETAQRYGNVGLAHPDEPSQFADEILHALDVETEPGPGPDLPEIKQKLLEVYQCAARRA